MLAFKSAVKRTFETNEGGSFGRLFCFLAAVKGAEEERGREEGESRRLVEGRSVYK